jgi:Secretion system C-terminal sorting domain
LNVSNQNVHVSISETEASRGAFEVYPNPGTGYLMWNKLYQFVQMDVYDVYGKLCYSDFSAASIDHCDLTELATGTYIVRAHGKDNQTFFSRYEKITGE